LNRSIEIDRMAKTKERILDTAERLFAERGYGATSLRSIIAAAKVNLAAVHYHFHSKEALLDAVLKRRIEPLNRERMTLLDEYERDAGDVPPPIEAVLTALIDPPLRLARDPSFAMFVKLMGRIFADGDAVLIRKHFGAMAERFMGAIHRGLPDLPPEEVRWRAYFAIAILAHTLLGTKGIVGATSEPTTERLVTFISAGFRAPVRSDARSSA
jgi:AcrR family transcriptional regulator